jgi:hypothetical protein
MSLGLKAFHTGGEFSPRIEYNAKSGRITRVDRTADGTDVIKIDLTMSQPMFAWDLGSIEVGWINFQAGAAPAFDVVPFGQPMPPRPDRNHKAGFRSKVWDGRDAAAREFSATAGVTVNAIEALWDLLAVAPEAAAGRVPVIQLVNVEPIASQRGTNYAPVFRVVQWVDRDERVFGPRTVATPGAAPIPAAAPVVPAATALVAAAWPTPAAAAPVTAAWPVAA